MKYERGEFEEAVTIWNTRGTGWQHSRYHFVAALEAQDTKSRTNFFQFRWFIDPSGPNQLYQTSLLSKILDLNDRNFFGEQSL